MPDLAFHEMVKANFHLDYYKRCTRCGWIKSRFVQYSGDYDE